MMEQLIPLEGTFNFRDIGGYQTSSGRTIACGKLFRADALHKLTGKDLQALQSMQIKTVVDFRSQTEADAHPDIIPPGAQMLLIAPHAEIAAMASLSKGNQDAKRIKKMEQHAATEEGQGWFAANLDSMEEQMRKFAGGEDGINAYSRFMKLVANPESAPLIFHCKGGKDRTGWAAALIMLALNVPRNTIMQDYMNTAKYNKTRNENRMEEYRRLTNNPLVLAFMSSLMQVKEKYLLAAFDELDKLGGEQKYFTQVLKLSNAELENLHTIYLD